MKLLQQGDDLLVRLSKTNHLFVVTFFVAFFEATVSPLLPEAFLLIVLAYRKDISWKLLSLVSAIGSSCGALLMYVFGATLYSKYGEKILSILHGESVAEKAKMLFDDNAFSAQFFAALTPLPDRVFSFLAGAFFVSPVIIVLATFCGRLLRVAPVAYLSFEYGDEARAYIKKHTKNASIMIGAGIVCYVCYKIILSQ